MLIKLIYNFFILVLSHRGHENELKIFLIEYITSARIKIFIILAKIKIYRIMLLQFYWFMDTCYDISNHFYYNWLEI